MFNRKTAILTTLIAIGGAMCLAAAAVDSFEYQFDTKDGIEGWTANGESKIEWVAGKDKEAGFMKISGDHASADSPKVSFKCGDNEISFDYLVHGTDTLRMRVSVVGDAQKTYGRYGNLMVRKVEPDKWVHVDAKLIDLPGMAEEGKAKATADLEYNSFGFSTISEVEDGGYIQIKNVKMAKGAPPATQKTGQ